YQSPSIERQLGYRADDPTTCNAFSNPIVHPDDLEAQRGFFDAIRGRPGVPVKAEFRLRHADGSWRAIEALGPNLPHGPAVAGIVANYRDVTDLKRSEEALRASERRLRVFVDHAADAFFMTDEQGRVLDVNGRACEARGYTRDELIRMPPYDFVAD